MPSLELVLIYFTSLGPYFAVAMLAAALLAFFVPWGIAHPEKWFFVYLIPLCMLALGGSNPSGEGSLYKQITWSILYLLTAGILYKTRNDKSEPAVRIPIEIWLLLAFILASTLWSPYRATSLKRYMLLAGLVLLALQSARMSIKAGSFAKLIGPSLTVFMLMGGLFAVVAPSLAFDDGALRGFSSHKNSWGQFSLLCGLVFAHNVMTKTNRLTYLPMLAVAIVMVILAKSSTSLLALCAALAFMMLFYIFTRSNHTGTVSFLLITSITALGELVFTVLNGELPIDALINFIFKFSDRSTTLTGRTQLWLLMLNEAAQHPWLGQGYGGFWVGLEGPSGVIAHQLDWGPPSQAHSGYIDTYNEIGIVGSILTGIVIIRHLWRCLKLYKLNDLATCSLHSAITIAILMHNYAESTFLLGTSFTFIIFFCSIIEVNSRLALLDPAKASSQRTSRSIGVRTDSIHVPKYF